VDNHDPVFAQFLSDYLRLSPEKAAFANRLLREMRRGASPRQAVIRAAN